MKMKSEDIKRDDGDFHIGRIIKEELKKQERSVAWLARKIHYDPSSLNRILKKPYIEMDIVLRSSVALGRNFSADFEQHVIEKMENSKNNE